MTVNTYYILLSILFSLISIATFIVVATFSKKLTFFSLFSTVIGIIGYNIVFVFRELETIQFLSQNLCFWTFLGGMIFLVINLILVLFAVRIHSKRKKLIFSAKEKYYNKYFCLLAKNDNMLLFNHKIKKILSNEQNITKRKDIYKLLKKADKPKFNLFVENNNVVFELEKKDLFYKEKLVGFAYVGSYDLLTKILTDYERKEENKGFNKSSSQFFNLSFDMSSETVMYFDFELGKYVLSNYMKELLNEKDNYLSEGKYQEKIVSSDLVIYLKKEYQSEFINKYEYRVKTEKGILKFEELVYKDNNKNYDIIRPSSRSHTEVNYLSKTNLKEDIEKYYSNNSEFIFIYIDLKTITKTLVFDKELGDLLTKNYFILLKDKYLDNKVYRLENNQFAFLLNIDEGTRIKTDLENNCSLLTSMEIMLDNEKILIENVVSFIYANDIEEKTADNLIRIAINEIYMIRDSENTELYSIYQVPKKDEEYKFEDMIIDLNDDDLDEFL